VAERHGLGRRLLGVETVFGPAIPASAAFVEAFERLYDSLRRHGVSETLRQVLGE
ncbi:mannitol dehydrogenase family protein, partial [Pseudomonas aeruginosa]|nr:mannitol dehydrogenase family protein [Pseudomonas aeruginosa]